MWSGPGRESAAGANRTGIAQVRDFRFHVCTAPRRARPSVPKNGRRLFQRPHPQEEDWHGTEWVPTPGVTLGWYRGRGTQRIRRIMERWLRDRGRDTGWLPGPPGLGSG